MTEKKASFYNRLYRKGGHNREYFKTPEESVYYPVWSCILDNVNDGARIADFGCGPGQLAWLAFERRIEYVLGVDFSRKAIGLAQELNKEHKDVFVKGNLSDPRIYRLAQYDTAIFSEVLEHIEDDLEVISYLGKAVHVLASLPSFASESHVRHFDNEQEVIARYAPLIDIKNICVAAKFQNNTSRIYVVHGIKK